MVPWTIVIQAPLSLEFSRTYWSGLPFPFSGDLPNPGIELVSPSLAGRFFSAEPPVKLQKSGLTVILPLICTLTIQGQYPVLCPLESPQGAPLWGVGVVAVADGLIRLYFSLEAYFSLGTHHVDWSYNVMT